MWLNPDSDNLVSFCGEYGDPYSINNMLNAVNQWFHIVNEVHEFVLDFGSDKDITKIRWKNNGAGPPNDVDVYVSTDGSTWGTAVAEALDFSVYNGGEWTVTELTQKTGRYIKFVINDTTNGSNYLGWGSSTTKVIDVLDGTEGDKFTTFVDLVNTSLVTTSTTYTPTDGSLCMVEIPWDEYTNITSIKLVARTSTSGSCTPNSYPTAHVQLYDRTNSAQLTNLFGPSNGLAKSGNFVGSIPSGTSVVDVRIKRGCQTNAGIYHCYLEIVQETAATTKTVVFVPIGANVGCGQTAFSKMGYAAFLIGGVKSQKHFLYDSGAMDGITAAYYCCNFYAQSGYTAEAKLDDISAGGALASFSETLTVPTHHTSADIKDSFVNSTEYTQYGKISASRRTAYFKNGYIRFHLTNPTKLQTFLPLNSKGIQTEATGWAEDGGGSNCYWYDSDNYFAQVTVGYKLQAILCHENDTSMSTGLYDDGTRDTDGDLNSTSETLERKLSGAITGIADQSVIGCARNLESGGEFIYGYIGSLMIIHSITGIDNTAATTRRIFIT